MSDEELRERERRLARSGSPADAARLLRERVRAGSLPQAHLELAAHLGHGPALLALGRAPTARPPFTRTLEPQRSFEAWVAALIPHGPPVLVRAAAAAARVGLDAWTEVYPTDARVPEAVAAAEAWAAGGVASDAPELRLMADAARAAAARAYDDRVRGDAWEDARMIADAAWSAAAGAAGDPEWTPAAAARDVAQVAFVLVDHTSWDPRSSAVQVRLREEAVERVRAAIRAAVLPWSLAAVV